MRRVFATRYSLKKQRHAGNEQETEDNLTESGFVEEAKASGLVARAIGRTGARGVSVAPRVSVP